MSEFFNQLADELRSQNGNAGNPPVPPAAPVGDPPAGDPPAAPTPPANTPPANTPPAPPAGDPPAGDPPAGDPPAKKEWYEDSDTVPNTPQTPANTQAQPDPIELDEDLKLLMEYKKSGKTLKDFVQEYQVQDVDSLSDEQIVMNGLKELLNLTDEEMETAKYEYENSTIIQKKELARQLREQYTQRNQEKLKRLTGDNAKYAEQQTKAYETYKTEVEQFRTQIVDKEVYGLKVTAEMANELVDFAENQISFQRPDGTYDIEKIFSVAMWLKHGKEIVKANVTKARNEGKEQVLREVTNPSTNTTGGGRVVGSGLEALQEAFNNRFLG